MRAVNLPAPPDAARPRILVTFGEEVPGERGEDYLAALTRAGGDPVAFTLAEHARGVAVPAHAGLVLTGGVDVDPARYGEPPDPNLGRTLPERDEMELGLLGRALAARRPLLAICRGAQLLNVACGGSLHQHIAQRDPHRTRRAADGTTLESGWHDVEVAPGTLLARMAGPGPLRVNSRHHQAVTPSRLAPGLAAAGRTDEGGLTVLEAIEVPDHPFALGVQWHPERPELALAAEPARRAASAPLFEAFVAACRVAATAPHTA